MIDHPTAVQSVLRWRVARQRQPGLTVLRGEVLFKPVKESWKHRIKRVIHGANVRVWKANRDKLPAWTLDGIVRIVALHKMPCASHRGGIQQVEEHIRREIVGIHPHRVQESLFDRTDTDAGEGCVIANEVRQQAIQVHQGVVHRRSRHQHQLFGRCAHQ